MTYFPVPEAGGPPEESARSAEVGTVFAAVPEFLGRYLELVELCDDDPGANEAFCELAEFVAELADGLEQFRPLLTRCLARWSRWPPRRTMPRSWSGGRFSTTCRSMSAGRAPVAGTQHPRGSRSDRGTYRGAGPGGPPRRR